MLLKTRLLLIENVFKPLAKSFLIPLGLTVAAFATDAAVHKKMLGSSNTTLIISNKEMNDVMKILKSPEGISELMKIKQNNKRRISWNVIRHFRSQLF